jgi:hypothetical protein
MYPVKLSRDKSGPYALAIALLGLHRQFDTSILIEGEPLF